MDSLQKNGTAKNKNINMKIKKQSANAILVIVTVLWGSGFVFTKMALDFKVSAGLINIARGIIFALISFIFFFKHIIKGSKKDFFVGFVAGSLNSLAFLLQTIAMNYTGPSNTGFFTVTNVLMVPFIVWIFYKKKPPIKVFLAVGICLLGMAILTGFFGVEFEFNVGIILALIGALMFAFSIAFIANSAKDTHFSIVALVMGISQAVVGVIYFFLFEGGIIGDIQWTGAILVLLYLGIFPSFIAQSCQVFAQQNTSATTAAIIMTLEAFFGSVFSIILGYDKATWTLLVGGFLILTSLFISEFPFPNPQKDKNLK